MIDHDDVDALQAALLILEARGLVVLEVTLSARSHLRLCGEACEVMMVRTRAGDVMVRRQETGSRNQPKQEEE